MNFYIPTKIHVERNCVSNYKTELASLGTKALIVTGANSSKQNGSLKDVTEALSAQGVLYVIFDSIEQNPSLENVEMAAKVGKDENVDYIIGIGGGSPMDAAKAVAVLVANPDKQARDLYDPVPLKALPVVEVPTTAGTGSEATPYAILTLHEEQTKRSMAQKVFPELALVDPNYLNFSNKDLLVNTAIDALAHLIESYLNADADPFNRMLSEYGLDLWGSVKEVLLIEEDPTEEEAETLALASTIAGMAISHTGTSLPHAMSYYLTYEKGIPHGNAVGIFLPAFIDMYEDRSQVKTVLRLLEFRNEKSFFKFIDSLFDIVSIEQDELDRYVDGMLSNERKLAKYPFPMTRETMELLFVNSVSVEKKKLFSFFKKNKKGQPVQSKPVEEIEAVIEPEKPTEEEKLAALRAEQEKAKTQAKLKEEEERKKAQEQERAEKEKAYHETREKALMAREQAAREAAEAKKQASAAIEPKAQRNIKVEEKKPDVIAEVGKQANRVTENAGKTVVIPNITKAKKEEPAKKSKPAGRSLFAPQPESEMAAKPDMKKVEKPDLVKNKKKVSEPVKVEPVKIEEPKKVEPVKIEEPKKVEPKIVELKTEPKKPATISKPEINNSLESIKRAQAAAEAERKAREEVEKAAQMAAEEAKKAEEAAQAAARARAAAAARAEELERRLAEAERRAEEAKRAMDSLKDE